MAVNIVSCSGTVVAVLAVFGNVIGEAFGWTLGMAGFMAAGN